MGAYYIVVNPAKKQYLSIRSFGENVKYGGLVTGHDGRSLHTMAIAWLVCQWEDSQSVISADEVGGSWVGDGIYLASDSVGPDLNGLVTATAERPDRNLHFLARQEYEDMAPRVIFDLCDRDERIAEILAARTELTGEDQYVPCTVMGYLGRVVTELGCTPLEEALLRRHGEKWRREYTKAVEFLISHDERGNRGWRA
jgi:hypothetical protein